MGETLGDLFWNTVGIAPVRTLIGKTFKRLLGGLAITNDLGGVAVLQLIERKVDARQQARRLG